MQSRLSNVKRHEDAYKHLQTTSLVTSTRKIYRSLLSKYTNKENSMDIQYAVVMGELSQLINKENRWFAHWNWFQVGEMKWHRTKCACLIKNDISCFTWRNCDDVKGEKYFVLINESTDLAYINWLCIAVCYYSKGNKALCCFFALLHCPCGGDGF